ncbi:non-ribosomal peptide synthetase [Fluviispira sanaruensis]|uniref:Non-ribosomal peptide synthetase n=1 Tax=Fluviispira sanaruensis TaxID=2493639 RepID=A0A4P2VKY7_FLUSA|nr:non-ribosomal peptide synthetase [Fluviispira sanaruensis]BBH53956.1 non-ribosomal peptide synthetase [Fluviispira sanaruensis]
MNREVRITPFQKTFYFEWKLDPSRTDYHMVLDQVLEGNLDIYKLRKSIKKFISEYYIINSHIEENNGEFYWVKNNEISELEYFEEIHNNYDIYTFIEKPFDLEKGPLYRYGIFKIKDNKYRFINVVQHALVDGASTKEYYNEIIKYYNSENIDNKFSLSSQYENILNTSGKLYNELNLNKESYLNFWKKNILECESIDTSFLKDPRLKEKSSLEIERSIQEYFGISEIKFSLNKEIFSKMYEIKKKYVITPYLFSKIIFAITIFKYTKQKNFCISYPVSIKEGADLIFGANVNINLLPFNFHDDITVEEIIDESKLFLKSVKDEKIRNNYFPIQELISKTKKNLTNVSFSSANFQNILLEIDGIKSIIMENSNIALTIEFIFEIETTSQGINFRIDYKNKIISQELIKKFIETYQYIYYEVVNDLLYNNKELNKNYIKKYSALNKNDYNKIINNWNSFENTKSIEQTIIQRFEDFVEKNPSQKALVYGKNSLSYYELNKKSNQLANYLLANFNLKPETMIGLCLDRSEYMYIGILGTLKAGCAYVPIDPKYPKERIQYILEDTKLELILTNKRIEENLLCFNSEIKNYLSVLKLISLDSSELEWKLQNQKDINPSIDITENNLAYVIYTSGTTGKPKGVLIEHKGVVNIANERAKTIHLYIENSYINTLAYANYIFDAHVWELCISILNGHCLHLVGEEMRNDINILSEYISANKIDFAVLPPVILNKENIIKLKLLAVAGDKINKEIVDKYLNNGITVLNAYGPTESTIEFSIYHYNNANEVNIIGKPTYNNKGYILDSDLSPMPIGAIGELFIGGENLARGYLNRNDLTKEKFIKNPFQSEDEKFNNKNSRVYRTGDLARYLPDGNIEYVGRNDFQVKIRGFRIELGEIENTLLAHSEIINAIVISKSLDDLNSDSVNKKLVCYYISKNKIDGNELFQFLSEKIPEYMIPHFFIPIKEIPINSSGKIDKNALPKENLFINEKYIKPNNDLEYKICSIWEEVFGLPKDSVGIRDDFFRIGGDSIVSIQIVARLRNRYGISLSVKEIFKYKNVEKIAQILANKILSNDKLINVKNEQGLLIGESQLLPIQKWFFSNEFPNAHHWNQSFLIITEKLDIIKLESSINKLIEHHDAFRFNYYKNEDNWKQFYSIEHQQVVLKYLDITTLSEYEESDLFSRKLDKILTSWQGEFSIENSPLYSFGYIEGYKDGSARVFVAAHHLIIDTVSWRIIKEDLHSLYNGKELAKKATSYRQWTEYINSYHKFHAEERQYWDKVVLDFNSVNSIQNQILSKLISSDSKNHREEFKLSKDLSHNLLHSCHKTFKTKINDILLSAFSLAITKLTNITNPYVALENHGREDLEDEIDINNTIGWFTTMYPICLSSNSDYKKQIILTKEQLRNVPANGVGFGSFYNYHSNNFPLISFNYLGKIDNSSRKSLSENKDWQISIENSGRSIHNLNIDKNFITVNCGVYNDIYFFIIETQFSNESTKKLCSYFEESIEELVNFTKNINRTYLTSSDIDNIISQKYLNQLQNENEIEDVLFANSLQQGFVYHSIKQGDKDDAYMEQIVWEYKNDIQIDKLKKAWEISVQKYENLRLRFAWEEEIIQIIEKDSELQWNYIDLSYDLNEQNKDNFLKKLQVNDRLKRYDLKEGKLSRIYLIKFNDNKYICLFSNHHAILDGWSNSILLNYVHSVYLNLIDNKLINLNQDKKYSEIQKYIMTKKNENRDYWKEYISKIEDHLDLCALMTDEAKEQNISCNSYSYIQCPKEYSFSIDGEDYLNLKEMCQNNSINLNSVFQFSWHKALSLYANSEQTTVGVTVSGRNLPIDGIENAVGLLINTLPIYVDHKNSYNKKVIDCIREIQEQINEINSRSNVNLSEINNNGQRLFNNIFVYENYPNVTPKEFENRINIKVRMDDIFEKLDYPLTAMVYEKGYSINFKIKYAGELFKEITIHNLISVVKEIINQIINNPFIESHLLKFMSDNQFNKIVYDWNKTENKKLHKQTLASIFEEKVSIFKNSVALIYKDKKFSYNELNEMANQLAHFIKDKFEINDNIFIAICLNRSEKIIVAILAILKLGKAYLPIDPNLPNDRIQYILEDAKPTLVLVDQENSLPIEIIYPKKSICIDSKDIIYDISMQKKENPFEITSNNNLAYLLYTSGTTGRPKGVMMGQDSCINRILYMINQAEITQDDSYLFKTNIIFDVSFSDIFCALISGIKLYISEQTFNIQEIESIIKKYNISMCHFAPSQFKVFFEEVDINQLTSLNKVMLSGEAIELTTLKKYLTKGKTFYNYYGPTETGEVTLKKFSSDSLELKINSNRSFIGKAFDQCKIYVLNKNLQVLPIYATGELYIGGIYVAEGYLNNKILTCEKFIDNPFQTELEKKENINNKLYKTGDLVRLLETGDLEYLGRNDSQVKIRGHRIELGEIENALIGFQNIKHVALLAKELSKQNSSKIIVCYYVSDKEVNESELSLHLSKKLPDYMIPSIFIHLNKLPLTVNGKLDYKSLPDAKLKENESYLAPRNDIENKMCLIWEEVLSLPKGTVGIKDDFFSLGGNSILAIKLVNQLNRKLEINISLKNILDCKNINNLLSDNKFENNADIIIHKFNDSKLENQVLSFAQERLWFIEKISENINSYNIPMLYKIKPNVNVNSIILSLKEIISRHEILRTVIIESEDGKTYQNVLFEEGYLFTVNKIDCTSRNEFEYLLKNEINFTFNLSKDIPIRISLFNVLENDNIKNNYLNIVVHHIAFDGWSVGIFLKEIIALYDYYESKIERANLLDKIPLLEFQYKDFAHWQRDFIRGDILERQLEYWKNKLSCYEALELPIDKQRPSQIDYNGKNVYLQIDENLSNELKKLAKRLDVSLYSLFLSAFYLLLSCYSGQKDIIVGSPISNRHYNKFSNLIGFFVNTFVQRAYLDPEYNLVDFIKKVGREVIEAQTYQDLPFEMLLKELAPNRDQGKHPLFQALFGMQHSNFNEKETENLFYNLQECDFILNSLYSPAKFDLSLFIDDSFGSFLICINYATSLFHEETIDNYLSVYKKILSEFSLLNTIYLNKEFRLKQINYLTNDHFQKISESWKNPYEYYDKNKTISQIFEEQVEKTPSNIAIVADGNKLTYLELNQRANKLANYLRENYKIMPDCFIALCLERNEYMLISILAVLKAGAAYVPIDPDFPTERMQFILEDTNTKILIANDKYRNLLNYDNNILSVIENSKLDIKIIFVDSKKTEKEILLQSSNNIITQTRSHHLAYVIYTSGTTGKPKGVLVEHNSFANLIAYQRKFISQEFGNKFINCLFFINYVFDANILELSSCIFQGNCLFIVNNETRKDFNLLSKYISENKIQFAVMPPALLDRIEILNLDVLVVGGEKTPKEIIQAYLYKNKRVINGYGPTEITVMCCAHNYKNSYEANWIGKLVANARGYVLDANLNLLPIGAVGELYIGGLGVSRGYLNKDKLTAEKYLNNPYQTHEEELACVNSRIYKTGDLVKLLTNGNLEYIGRNDSQVKINGFRIELAEIESAVLSFQGVKHAAVIVKESEHKCTETNHNKILVCYYVPENQISEQILVRYLSEKLPDYMVPKFYIPLDKLPLNFNGKLDVKALPAPIFTNNKNYIAPITELEKNICSIWESILGLPNSSIGLQDNFFSLGGDSIICIQIVASMRNKLNVEISVKDIFKYKTISSIVIFMQNKQKNNNIPKISEQGILSGLVPLMPIQKWFFVNEIAKKEHWNHSFLIKTPDINFMKLKESIYKLVEYHDSFRLRFKNCENKWTQYYDSDAPKIEIKNLDILNLNEDQNSIKFKEKLNQIFTSWQDDFNFEQGPMYAFGFIHGFADKSTRVFVALHHLLVDSVSWRIIVEDLQALYDNKNLCTKGTSYRQWSQCIEEYKLLNKSEKVYWNEVLFRIKEANSLITNEFKKYMDPNGIRNKIEIKLDYNMTQKLLVDCHKTYRTQINEILLSSFISALKQLMGASMHCILIEGHGREEIDSSCDVTRTIGWFTSMYPVIFESNNDLAKQINNVKDTLNKVPNNGIGFGALHDYSPDDLPSISFNYLGQFKSDLPQENGKRAWKIVNEESGLSMYSMNLKNNYISANGVVIDGELSFFIETGVNKKTTEDLGHAFHNALIENINHCLEVQRSQANYEVIYGDKIFENYDYNPILKLNEAVNKKDLFMIHPARTSCEVYSELSSALSNDFQCYGVEYFNIFHENKIKDFYVLAEYYLRKIEKIMSQTKQKEYHLFGWSLGGYIALEIASILEKRDIKEINIYLLDSFYYDEFLVNNKLNLDAFIEYTSDEVNLKDFDRVVENYDIENSYLDKKISSTLKYSKILLFKAMKYKKSSANEKVNMVLKYLTDLKENNIHNVIYDKKQFKMVCAHDATHLSIIQEEKLIIDEMKRFCGL